MVQVVVEKNVDNTITLDGSEYILVRKNEISKDRYYIEDELLRWSHILEETARHIKDGEVFTADKIVKMKKLMALMEEHRDLDKL